MGTGVRGKRPGASSKSVPYLSHEFVIQNHGDIATCICMVFVVGLMFQTTAPLASTFIAPKHNITEMPDQQQAKTAATPPLLPVLYTYGLKDLCLVFFYTITVIIAHAVIQEYILDKWMRKVKLSKTKASKFNESGQLVVFYILSAIWAGVIFRDDGYFQTLSFFWTAYPHIGLTFLTKFFFVIQMSYWLHLLPELYFQKVKREDIASKVVFALINLSICLAIYVLNLTRIGLTLLFIDYSINALFHVSRILYFSGKNGISKLCFNIYNVLFVLARLTAAILSIFVFWFGLATSSVEHVKWDERNFNTPLVRTLCLGTILLLQGWMLWNFILFQCKKIRENAKPTSTPKPVNKPLTRKAKAAKEESDTEVDRDLKETTNGDIKKKSD